MAEAAGLHGAVARLTEETRCRNSPELTIDSQHTAVEGDVLAAVLELIDEPAA
jgi:hypothetical protein